MPVNKQLLPWAGIAGASGVALGAFGAHALQASLEASGHTGTWDTAVLYHLVHAVAVLALGLSGWSGRLVGWFWLAGIVLFSGSLYALSLGGPGWLGPVTPLGGLAFILGWGWLGVRALRSDAAPQ